MKHWLYLHWLSLRATLGYFVSSPLTVCLNIFVISLALSVPLGLFAVLANGKAIADTLAVDSQLTVFMHADCSAQERAALESWLNKQTDVHSVRFVSKEQGLHELATHSGLTDLLGGLPDNPLPDVFVVALKTHDPARLEALQQRVNEESGVESVLADSAWAKRLTALLTIGKRIFTVLVSVLGAALVLVTGNSIRMQILTRLEEIEVSKLIGASDAFIRRPFLYFAILQGVAGSVLAYGLVTWAFWYINPSIQDVAALYNIRFALVGLQETTLLGVCAITTSLCLLGALFSVGRHLRRFR